MSPGVILFALAGSLALGVAGLWQYQRGRGVAQAALDRTRDDRGERRRGRLVAAIDARLRRARLGQRLSAWLRAAGVEQSPAECLLLVLGGAVVVSVIGGLIAPRLIAALAALAVVAAGVGYVRRQRAQRTEQFVAQLPELARILSNATSAGLAMTSALGLAAAELDDPARSVLGRVGDELRLGQSLDTALRNLEASMPSREVAVLVTTVIIQQRAGGDVVAALREMGETLETRKELRREVQTTMSGVVYTGYLVAVMGVGSVFLLNMIDPLLLDEMTGSWLGRVVLVVSFGLYALGFVLIRRTTRVDT